LFDCPRIHAKGQHAVRPCCFLPQFFGAGLRNINVVDLDLPAVGEVEHTRAAHVDLVLNRQHVVNNAVPLIILVDVTSLSLDRAGRGALFIVIGAWGVFQHAAAPEHDPLPTVVVNV
jgi:hypothetical protein